MQFARQTPQVAVIRKIAMAALCLLCMPGFGQQKADQGPELPWVPGKRWAIVVGASGYEHYGKLEYADDDAVSIADALVHDFRFDPETVRVLTDRPESKLKPTAGNIIGEVEDALANKALTKSDLFVFFFAGHGVGTDKGDFLLPTDARPSAVERVGLPVSELIDRFTKAGLKNVLILVDACRSGKANPFGKQLQQLGREANLAVMLGCSPGARSYEDISLKHGVFAHHLLEALKRQELRDSTSGALWASSIGSWVKKNVKDFTERDYGADAQDPYVWGNRADDVLLGAYVPRGDGNAVQAFGDKAKSLSPDSYRSSMALFGEDLFNQGRFAECVEVMKTLAGLGELEPNSEYLLGTAFMLTDRTSEAARSFAKLASRPEPYWRNVGICTDVLSPISVDKRLAAARELWSLDKTWLTGYMAWSVFFGFGTREDQESFLDDFLKLKSLTARRREFLRGNLEMLKGNLSVALASLQAAMKDRSSSEPDDHLISMMLLPILAGLSKADEMDTLIDTRTKGTEHLSYWLLLKATREKAKGKGPDTWMPYVVRAVSGEPTPEDLMRAFKIAGKHLGSIREAIEVQANKHPYSWKALAMKVLSAKIGGGDSARAVEALEEAERFAENKLECRTAIFEMLQPMMTELFDDGKLSPQQYVAWLDASWSMLFDYQEMLQQNYGAWWLIVEFGAYTERLLQTARLAGRLLGPEIDASRLRPDLAVALMLAFMNIGDKFAAEKVYRAAMKNGDPEFNARVPYMMFLASRGEFAEADKIAKMLPKDDSDEIVSILAWIDAGLGRKEGALAKLSLVKGKEGFVGAACGLAYNLLGDWAKAEPLLTQVLQNRSWGFFCVTARAFQVLWDKAKADKNADLLNELGFEAMLSQYGNPLFRTTGFDGAGSLATFAGRYRWTVSGHDENYEGFANADLQLAIEGEMVEGTFEDEKGTVMRVRGGVDEYGNLDCSVRAGSKELRLFAKLAPLALQGTYEPLRTVGQVFLLLDAKDARTVWIGKPG